MEVPLSEAGINPAAEPVADSSGSSIRVHELTRTFGSLTAVDRVSFEVPRGAFFGFLGTNGAGKSTTIRMLAGLLRPSSGTAELLGHDVVREPVEVKRRIGVVPEDAALFERLTGLEYLTFVGRMHGLSHETLQNRARELFMLLDMQGRESTLIQEYSKGMKKKIALAAALLYNPQILFLDEPFEGVDVLTSRLLRDLLRELTERGVTIFLTSHIIEVVQRLCTHFAIIHRGRLVAQGSLEDGRVREDAEERTLEEVFLGLVTDPEATQKRLSWLEQFNGA
jgi:ABC-2 type transport system ATP-binding protein